LPVSHAQNGECIKTGHIYVAPPDFHLIIKDKNVHLSTGPKENRNRPAIDPLFRSAASAYGKDVIGVILTGLLDDGTLGLREIKRAGGITIVQNPEDAMYPGMPLSAIKHVHVDHIATLEEMPDLLTSLVSAAMSRKSQIEKGVL
jgi:two-component system chemotaxis response regulator CheB